MKKSELIQIIKEEIKNQNKSKNINEFYNDVENPTSEEVKILLNEVIPKLNEILSIIKQ